VISGSYIESIDCDGPKSCDGAVIVVNEPKEHFLLNCAGIDACNGMQIEVHLAGPPPGFRCADTLNKDILPFSKIVCSDTMSCQGIQITVHNGGCNKVIIEEFICSQPNACNGLNLSLLGDVDIASCECGPSCNNAVGISQCFQNLEKYLCSDSITCMGQTKTITNPANAFKFECIATGACKASNFKIEFNENLPEPITFLDAFKFSGISSANGATFIIDNQQTVQLTVGVIECSGTASCLATTFITGPNVVISEINCANNACNGCKIKQSQYDQGIPCDPSATQFLPI